MKKQRVVHPPSVAELIDQFRNKALCREQGTQDKARQIWRKELYPLLTESETREINIEWHHYLRGEMSTDDFGEILNRIAAKYRTT